MAYKVKVVGVGPGGADYITPIAWAVVKTAQVLVGGQRLLDTFGQGEQLKFPIRGNLPEVVDFIREQMAMKQVVVLVSGDTGLFSFAGYLSKHIENGLIEYIPGVSSLQVMFARLKRPWNEAQILSLHGRDESLDILPTLVGKSKMTAILTDGSWSPHKIAGYLLANQVADLEVAIGKDLSYPQEELVHTTLKLLGSAGERDYKNSIMVIFNE